MSGEQLDCLAPVLKGHESKYRWHLTMLRLRLKDLALSRADRTVTADDAHTILVTLQLPKDADTRFMGALFKDGQWAHDGFVKSHRCQNHHRHIARWRLKGSF